MGPAVSNRPGGTTPRSLLVRLWASTLAAVILAACQADVPHAVDKMSLFVTSVQAGDGGNIGGLDAADAHCAKLAAAVGSPKAAVARLPQCRVFRR